MKNILIFFLTTLILPSCGGKKTIEKESVAAESSNSVTLSDEQAANNQLRTEIPVKQKMSAILKLNGTVDVPPQNLISISMPLGGFLKSTGLLPGMHVRQGDILATMEDEKYIDLQQEYLTARQKLIFDKNEYNRQKELNVSKAASDKYMQQTEMAYRNQQITVNSLEEKLKLIFIDPTTLDESRISRSIKIKSPIDGFVSRIDINIGKYVNPSDIIMELINPADIHLNLNVFEKDLDKLSVGQKLLAYNNNNPDKKYPCEVILVSQNLSVDRSAEVHCHFEKYDKSLYPGMYMNADVEIKSDSLLAIMDDAIVSFEGKDFVFINVEKNKYEMTEVIRGISEKNYTSISAFDGRNISNLRIVTKGAYSLLMQLKNKQE